MPRRVKHEPMQRPKGRPHPSGRPVRGEPYSDLQIERPLKGEPLTLGLRRDRQVYAVGFTAQIGGQDDDE